MKKFKNKYEETWFAISVVMFCAFGFAGMILVIFLTYMKYTGGCLCW